MQWRVSSDGSQSVFPALGNIRTVSDLNVIYCSLEHCRLHFDLVWTYKIIVGHVDVRSDDFLS